MEEEQIYLVYEYVDGASLKEFLRGSIVHGYCPIFVAFQDADCP